MVVAETAFSWVAVSVPIWVLSIAWTLVEPRSLIAAAVRPATCVVVRSPT